MVLSRVFHSLLVQITTWISDFSSNEVFFFIIIMCLFVGRLYFLFVRSVFDVLN